METSVFDERRRFVRDYARGDWTMRALCARYGITPPCGYKWWARFQADGEAGLADRSRAPEHRPQQTASKLEALIVAARRKYGWGATKLREVLRTRHPTEAWPARSTFNEILDRHQLLEKRRRVRLGRTSTGCPCRAPGPMRSGRFQGPVQDPRWRLLLSADHHRSLQPATAGRARALGDHAGRYAGGVSSAVSRSRSARSDSHRQRGALRVDRAARPVGAQHLVDATRHYPSANSAGPPPRQWQP